MQARSTRLARRLWTASLVAIALLVALLPVAAPTVAAAAAVDPLVWLCAAGGVGGVTALWSGLRGHAERRALLGSATVIAAALAGVAAALHPVALPAVGDGAALTVAGAAAAETGLRAASVWWPAALVMTLTGAAVVARVFRGKV